MVKITNLAIHNRPREKLIANGAKNLTEVELLQVIIGRGVKGSDVTKISTQIKKLIDIYGYNLSLKQLMSIRGISDANATKLQAVCELIRRQTVTDIQITSSAQAAMQVPELRTANQERLVVLSLDGANALIKKRVVSIGTLNSSLVHPREVFSKPIRDRAAGIVVIHNHPSGTLQPSDADISVTKRLQESGKLLGINLHDHIIITKRGHYSFSDSGQL